MSTVFLSYDRDDLERARSIALALEKAGHSVWWDRHIKGGAQYSNAIEEALKRAEAVLVLWSARSVKSAWVRDEAAAGRDSGRFVPVSLDATTPPLGFRQYQAVDLSNWNGRGKSTEFRSLLEAVDEMKREPAGSSGPAELEPSVAPRRGKSFAVLLVVLVITLAIGAALLVWRPWSSGAGVPVVAVAPANQSGADVDLARDLLVQLGSLRAVSSGALQLVENAGLKEKPHLILEVGSDRRSDQIEASVALFHGRARALLWSKEFEQPTAKLSDLRQQIVFTSARVLDCALEGMNSKNVERQTLKLYLNACSTYAHGSSADELGLASTLEQVTRTAPQLKGAWAKLLSVEYRLASNIDRPEAAATRRLLAARIAAARKAHPKLPEALIAEASLAPPNAFGSRMGLLEKALQAEPENPEAIAAYSMYLRKVGRTQESIQQARRATNLDPLSPTARDLLVSALTNDGQFEAALGELRKAERVWPGATTLLNARYRLHLRYGDAKEALRMHRSGEVLEAQKGHQFFLETRINPTEANVGALLTALRRRFQRDPGLTIVAFGQALGIFGREEELISILLNWRDRQSVDFVVDVLFRPALDKVRRDPRMMQIAARVGLLDYWRSSGQWPDFCTDPRLPYDCKQEAAKITA